MPYTVSEDYGTIPRLQRTRRDDRDQLNTPTGADVTRVRFPAYLASCDGLLSLWH